jgi:carboxymethylenebutenolidase
MTIQNERVEIQVSDGTTMGGYLYRPEGQEPRPAILVLQEIFGVNDNIRSIAERFAREGYVTLAPDLFHRSQPDFVGSYDNFPGARSLAMKYTAEHGELDLRAAVDFLAKHPAVDKERIGSLGFCMGGRLSFVANAITKLRAAVSFYGNIAPDKLPYAERLSGPMLMIWAGKDAFITQANVALVVEALRKVGKPYVSVEFSAQNHGFFCDARSDYDDAAAAQAFALTAAFFKTNLG